MKSALHNHVTCLPGKGLDESIEAFEANLEEHETQGTHIDEAAMFRPPLPVYGYMHGRILGMPLAVRRVLRKFHANLHVWFANEGIVLNLRFTSRHGILQGCAASIMLLATVMSA